MTEELSYLIVGTLTLHLLFALLLAVFWLKNRSAHGLAAITLSSFAAFVGFYLGLRYGEATSLGHVFIVYLLLITGHAAAWIGLADFWHRKSKRLTAFAVLAGVITLLGVLYYTSGGGGAVGRQAIASIFFALSSLAAAYHVFKAKAFRIDIYESAIRESRVGSYFVIALFVLHGLVNLYRMLSWPELGVDTIFAAQETGWIAPLTVMEALIFTPLYVAGVILMVVERLQTQLRVEQMLEPVTRSLNRGAFLMVARVVLARARRNADAVSILIIEIGNIADLRRVLGRTGCDKILKQVANAVVLGRREQDVFCRFSGDEFLLMLPGTPEEGAAQVLERVIAEIEDRSYKEKGKEVRVRARVESHTARGEDLEAEGMIDAVAKKLTVEP